MRRAANSSASRSRPGRRARAPCATAEATCRSAAEAGLQRSKRAVYSMRAASPRVRTASRISAVARSTPSSWAASKASNRANSGSKPGASVERRRGSAMDRLRDRLDEGRKRVALELQGSGIDDEAARDRHDLLDRPQAVRLQRVAGVDEVDDRIGEAHERRELHRAVEADQVHVHALGGEMLARGTDVLGRDSQARALLHRRRVIELLADRDDHAALRDAEVERL